MVLLFRVLPNICVGEVWLATHSWAPRPDWPLPRSSAKYVAVVLRGTDDWGCRPPYLDSSHVRDPHGRGGQRVVTSAELPSVAAFVDGRHARAVPHDGCGPTASDIPSPNRSRPRPRDSASNERDLAMNGQISYRAAAAGEPSARAVARGVSRAHSEPATSWRSSERERAGGRRNGNGGCR